MLNKVPGIRRGETVFVLLFPSWLLNHIFGSQMIYNADILKHYVKLGIIIYNEFKSIYSFNKSLTHLSNKIYFRASNLVNIILIHIGNIYILERLTRTVTHHN